MPCLVAIQPDECLKRLVNKKERRRKNRGSLRELVALSGLNDTVENKDIAVGGRLEDENVLVVRLLNVKNLLDLESHGLTRPEGAGLLEPAVLDKRVRQ